jgi:hypothetical protein
MPYCYPGGMSPVKDFVRDVWKIAAACACGAFLLSLVIGLIAGNPFGVVVFRALLLAVLFAGLGAGLRLVVKAYLPELTASTVSSAATDMWKNRTGMSGQTGAETSGEHRGAESAGYRGAAVDIVLQDDDGLRRQAYGGSDRAPGARPAEPGAGNPDDVGDQALEASLGEDFMSQGDGPGLAELSEELDEELPPAEESTGTAGSAGSQSEEGAVEETEKLPRAIREAPGGIDSLPDIDGLEPPPEAKPARTAPVRMPRPKAGEKPGDAVRNALSGQDPSTLARAIRTVLKNAEKG